MDGATPPMPPPPGGQGLGRGGGGGGGVVVLTETQPGQFNVDWSSGAMAPQCQGEIGPIIHRLMTSSSQHSLLSVFGGGGSEGIGTCWRGFGC